MFSTETQSWSTKKAGWVRGGGGDLVWFDQTKVLAVGGGVLAWVDLRLGILLCNVLAKDPVVRRIHLPPLMPSNNPWYGLRSDGTRPSLQLIRDVACCANGSIKLVEMEYPVLKNGTRDCLRWRATIFERMVYANQWEKRTVVNSTDRFPADGSGLPDEIILELRDQQAKRCCVHGPDAKRQPGKHYLHDMQDGRTRHQRLGAAC